jgi:hypothetical protein
VILDGVFGDTEGVRNLLVGQAADDQFEHFHLTIKLSGQVCDTILFPWDAEKVADALSKRSTSHWAFARVMFHSVR